MELLVKEFINYLFDYVNNSSKLTLFIKIGNNRYKIT